MIEKWGNRVEKKLKKIRFKDWKIEMRKIEENGLEDGKIEYKKLREVKEEREIVESDGEEEEIREWIGGNDKNGRNGRKSNEDEGLEEWEDL